MVGRGSIAGSPPEPINAYGGGDGRPDDRDDDAHGHVRHDDDDPWPSCRRRGRHVAYLARAIDPGYNDPSCRASNADSHSARARRNR